MTTTRSGRCSRRRRRLCEEVERDLGARVEVGQVDDPEARETRREIGQRHRDVVAVQPERLDLTAIRTARDRHRRPGHQSLEPAARDVGGRDRRRFRRFGEGSPPRCDRPATASCSSLKRSTAAASDENRTGAGKGLRRLRRRAARGLPEIEAACCFIPPHASLQSRHGQSR